MNVGKDDGGGKVGSVGKRGGVGDGVLVVDVNSGSAIVNVGGGVNELANGLSLPELFVGGRGSHSTNEIGMLRMNGSSNVRGACRSSSGA